jgi:hypothetical protein
LGARPQGGQILLEFFFPLSERIILKADFNATLLLTPASPNVPMKILTLLTVFIGALLVPAGHSQVVNCHCEAAVFCIDFLDPADICCYGEQRKVFCLLSKIIEPGVKITDCCGRG